MFDKDLVLDIIEVIVDVLTTIQRRTEPILSPEDFLCSDSGMILLDSVCMKLVAAGESIKNIDKITNRQLFRNYQSINWKDVMGMRDIIVHHYFDVDAYEIFKTIKEDVPLLLAALQEIQSDLKQDFS